MYLPLHIDLRGKKILVVGFGKVGKRRTEKLLRTGADITVIDRRKVRVKGNVKFIQKNLRPNNVPSLKGYFLVVAATDNKRLNAAISRNARRDGCLVNRVDFSKGGNVIFPAVVEMHAGIISFSTLGRKPRLSRQIKEAIERGVSKR